MTDRTPTTAAGRALAERMTGTPSWMARAILAIEVEARASLEAEIERLRVALERAIEAMDLVRDGLAVRSTDAIVIGEESILRHAAREARAALEEPTP